MSKLHARYLSVVSILNVKANKLDPYRAYLLHVSMGTLNLNQIHSSNAEY